VAKRSIHNADGSRRWTARGPHYNDGPDPHGPVRTTAAAAAVHRHELAFLQATLALRPPRPVGSLVYVDALPWPSLREPVRRRVAKRTVGLELGPAPPRTYAPPPELPLPPYASERAAYQARVGALIARKSHVRGV
jgi:hypothetical protein